MNSDYSAVRSDADGSEMASSVNGEYGSGANTDRFQQTRREVRSVGWLRRELRSVTSDVSYRGASEQPSYYRPFPYHTCENMY